MTLIEIGLAIVLIIINIYILYYVVDMEQRNCQCSESWLRNYIKVFSIILIFTALFVIAFPKITDSKYLNKMFNKNNLLIIPVILWNITSAIYLFVLLAYYYKLRTNECKCAENWKKNLLLYPILIMIPFVIRLSIMIAKRGLGSSTLQ